MAWSRSLPQVVCRSNRVASAIGALGILLASLAATPPAQAACAPPTGSNITVTCSGATLNQGPGINTGYGDGTQNGLTLTVQSGASVAGTSTGIDVNNNNTITNLGTITTAGSAVLGDVFGINANGPLTVNNFGTIGKVDIPNNLFDAAGINAGAGLVVVNNSGGLIQGAVAIQGAGSATITNSGTISGIVGGGGQGINVANNPSGAVTVTNNASGLITADGVAIEAGIATVFNSGTISAPGFGGNAINGLTSVNVTNFASGVITSDGDAISAPTITVTNFGTISGTGLAGSGINGGTVAVTNAGTILGGPGAAAISMTSGTVTNNVGGVISGDTGIAAFNNTTVFNAGTITGTTGTAITFFAPGNTLTIAPTSVITGNVLASGSDTFQLGGTGIGTFDLGSIGASRQYRGFASFNVVDATWTATNTFSQSSAWTVQSGTLLVNGDLSSANSLSVNGGTLGGTGKVGNTQINGGGTFAPGTPGVAGTSMTVAGNLAFQSGALYLVQVNPSTASIANVNGTATLTGGSVQAVFAPGSYGARSYDILHAAGGLGGTTFSGVSSNAPNFGVSLSYTATDVFLNLTGALGAGAALNQNQQNVANAINGFFNNGGTLPPNFANLFFLTGGNLGNALTLISGEAATGAQQGVFQLGSQFLNIMLDPFVDGRGGIGVGPAIGFAPERPEISDEIALAYAKVMKAPLYKAPPVIYEPRWTAWGAAYGGSNKTSGDPLVVGSHDLTARAGGVAAGLDYRVAPNTVVGFALAGGGTNWSLANGLGGGNSDAFQLGFYGATRAGAAYLAGGFAYSTHWLSTDRFAFAGDHLTARFNAQSFGARVEGGYRFLPAGPAGVGVTPYAALQAQSFRTPTYSELDTNGGGFGLTYNARTATDTRSELGARFDYVVPFTVYQNAVLTLRGRLAWAHDWITDPSLAAVFQTLPGASFIVNGATPARNSALASAGAELRLANGVALIGKFDGEFASHAQTYTGTGTLRVSW
jgi:outer membrane autotransporter protein